MPHPRRRILAALVGIALLPGPAVAETVRLAALYPQDGRRAMAAPDFARFPGAGILFCRDAGGVPKRAAAAWLIAGPRVVMLNAHNFRSRRLEVTRAVAIASSRSPAATTISSPRACISGCSPGRAHSTSPTTGPSSPCASR